MKKAIITILISVLLLMTCSCSSKIANNQDIQQKNGENNNVLSISVRGNGLQPFISEYEKRHNNITINLREYPISNEGSYDDYVKKVTTEILSNNASDIFSVQGIPYYQYIDKGALMNLTDLVKNDSELNEKNYFMNILDGCKYKDAYYAIPITYQFKCIGIDGDISQKIGIKTEKMGYNEFLGLLNSIYKGNASAPILPNIILLLFINFLLMVFVIILLI